MKAIRLLAGIMVLVGTQSSVPQVHELLSAPVPLSRARLEAILEATSGLMVGKSFLTYGGFGGGTVTVGPGPRVRFVYYGDRAREWTDEAARICDGGPAEGELVLEWVRERANWRVTARASTEPRILDGMFELWSRPPEDLRDGGFREVEGRRLRGLRFPYEPLEDARFEASWQSVWLDAQTGLPVRYEIAVEAPEAIDYGYFFAYAPGWSGGPAPSVDRPDCITTGSVPR